MSNNTIERALWDLHAHPDMVKSFHDDAASFLSNYPLSEEEQQLIASLNVRVMADQGVSQMLLFNSWQAIQGGAASIPEYMRRMNTPAE
ncbi:MAG: hypothetical protein ACPF9E_13255 [Alteromonas oceani]